MQPRLDRPTASVRREQMMSELKWNGPHSIRDMVLDVNLRPPDAPGIYVLLDEDVEDDPREAAQILYVGKADRLYGRFGDLAFGLLRLSSRWSFHAACKHILEFCDTRIDGPMDPLIIDYMWAEAPCARCAEIQFLGEVWPTQLNKTQAYNCGKHPKEKKIR